MKRTILNHFRCIVNRTYKRVIQGWQKLSKKTAAEDFLGHQKRVQFTVHVTQNMRPRYLHKLHKDTSISHISDILQLWHAFGCYTNEAQARAARLFTRTLSLAPNLLLTTVTKQSWQICNKKISLNLDSTLLFSYSSIAFQFCAAGILQSSRLIF